MFAITEGRINMFIPVVISLNSFSVWNNISREKGKLNTSAQWLCLAFLSVKSRKNAIEGLLSGKIALLFASTGTEYKTTLPVILNTSNSPPE